LFHSVGVVGLVQLHTQGNPQPQKKGKQLGTLKHSVCGKERKKILDFEARCPEPLSHSIDVDASSGCLKEAAEEIIAPAATL